MSKLTKKTISNLLFLIVIGLFLYPPSKTYIIRLIALSPSIIEEEKREKITDYNWKLDGLNTTDVNFDKFQGKVVFLNFWATWCPPCVAEMPSIQKLYETYKDKVSFILVSNENWQTIKKFYEENNFNLPVYNNKESGPNFLTVSSIPTTLIINKKGEVVVEKSGAADWNSKSVRSLLEQQLQINNE